MINKYKQILLAEKAEQEKERQINQAKIIQDRQTAQAARNSLLTHLRPATVDEYVKWLKIRIEVHGTTNLSFFRDPSLFYIATEYFTTIPLNGANAIHILIPNNLHIRPGNLGHNVFYLENGEILPHYAPIGISDEDLLSIDD